jgi:hypothetical protein
MRFEGRVKKEEKEEKEEEEEEEERGRCTHTQNNTTQHTPT